MIQIFTLPRNLFILCLIASSISLNAQSIDIIGPTGSGRFGTSTVLPNGNLVVIDPYYDDGAITDVGAVYLYDGNTLGLISTLKGSSANDHVGWGGISVLSNGNFVISSFTWNSGAGAVTWINCNTGLSGIVTSSNSLIGVGNGINVGRTVQTLPNGNYVVSSPYWGTGSQGAITWGSGTSGKTGIVSSSNSIIGDTFGGLLGFSGVTILSNSNYVISYPLWNGGFGATMWCDGTIDKTGFITSSNALVGSNSNDGGGGVTALTNGNYVVFSWNWSNGTKTKAGAITWCNGTAATVGVISSANSFIGANTNDQLGVNGIIALSNGNYIILSPYCDNGSIVDVGAVTWGNGNSLKTGTISSSNSLMGSSANDNVGTLALALSNGNYVVGNPNWDNGAITDAGAITWGNGNTGITGIINSINSLVGSTTNDNIGGYNSGSPGLLALTNGNYVALNPYWDNGAIADAGAATWCNGNGGTAGIINISNSLVGTTINDNLGSNNAVALTNGNYVISIPNWDNGAIIDAGAATWANGTTGLTGSINGSNSLIGNSNSDLVGYRLIALSNNNYVVGSPNWDNGAITDAGAATWANGTTGLTGSISNSNSLVGSTAGDNVGSALFAFNNGNYVVTSYYWDNGATNTGAETLCNSATGMTGTINSCNSVLGTAVNGGTLFSYPFGSYNFTYDYLTVGRRADNIVTIFDPTNLQLANTQDTQSLNISGINKIPIVSSNACRVIGTITPGSINPVSGIVNAKVWVETSVPTYGGIPFVARHYQITPTNNASSATAKITLYFTQQEFTDFNNAPGSILNLPNGPSDIAAKANLRIVKFGGSSNDGTGFPGSYPGGSTIIDPADADIVWKSNYNRWEVTFDVNGFSGFIVQTNLTITPLTWLEFNATLKGNDCILNWKTTNEINTSSFDIERSVNGSNYFVIGNTTAINQAGDHNYSFTDRDVASLGVAVIYYRIKQKDFNGRFTESGIIPLHISSKNVIDFFPNPVINKVNIITSITTAQQLQLRIMDNTGKIVFQQKKNLASGSSLIQIDLANLAKGIYYLELNSATISAHKKFIKQ